MNKKKQFDEPDPVSEDKIIDSSKFGTDIYGIHDVLIEVITYMVKVEMWRKHRKLEERYGPERELCVFPPPPLRKEIEVRLEDIEKLYPGQWLNDVIIDIYTKYLIHMKYRDLSYNISIKSVYFMSTLKSFLGGRNVRLLGQENIFLKSFVLIPYNIMGTHWCLIVICYPNRINLHIEDYDVTTQRPIKELADEIRETVPGNLHPPSCIVSRRNYGVTSKLYPRIKRPCILVLDSLKQSDYMEYEEIRKYVNLEWNHAFSARFQAQINLDEENFPAFSVKCPQQENGYDCGVFMLHNIEKWLSDHEGFYCVPPDLRMWYDLADVPIKRYKIFKFLLEMISQQDPTNFCKCENSGLPADYEYNERLIWEDPKWQYRMRGFISNKFEEEPGCKIGIRQLLADLGIHYSDEQVGANPVENSTKQLEALHLSDEESAECSDIIEQLQAFHLSDKVPEEETVVKSYCDGDPRMKFLESLRKRLLRKAALSATEVTAGEEAEKLEVFPSLSVNDRKGWKTPFGGLLPDSSEQVPSTCCKGGSCPNLTEFPNFCERCLETS